MTTKTRALLIGINDYSPVGNQGPDLKACINDVEDMRKTLIACGYQDSQIKTLTDKDATKNNILTALEQFINMTQTGESIVFYFAGHGYFATDFDGNEIDGRDEVICPHDWPNEMIIDDEIANIFSNLVRGATLEVIMDCCHAGTITTSAMFEIMANRTFFSKQKHQKLVNSVSQERGIGNTRTAPKMLRYNTNYSVTTDISLVDNPNHILWAACKDNQNARQKEIDGAYRSVFTYYFCQALKSCNGNIKRATLFLEIVNKLNEQHYVPIPVLHLPIIYNQIIFT